MGPHASTSLAQEIFRDTSTTVVCVMRLAPTHLSLAALNSICRHCQGHICCVGDGRRGSVVVGGGGCGAVPAHESATTVGIRSHHATSCMMHDHRASCIRADLTWHDMAWHDPCYCDSHCSAPPCPAVLSPPRCIRSGTSGGMMQMPCVTKCDSPLQCNAH